MLHFTVQLCLVRWQQMMLRWCIKTLPQRITTSAMRQGLWECKVNDFLSPKKCFVMFRQNSWLSRSSCSSSYPRELSHSDCALPQRWVAQIEPHTFCAGLCEAKMSINPYPTAFPYRNGMVLHFYQQQESSTTKTVHKVINKGLKTYV